MNVYVNLDSFSQNTINFFDRQRIKCIQPLNCFTKVQKLSLKGFSLSAAVRTAMRSSSLSHLREQSCARQVSAGGCNSHVFALTNGKKSGMECCMSSIFKLGVEVKKIPSVTQSVS